MDKQGVSEFAVLSRECRSAPQIIACSFRVCLFRSILPYYRAHGHTQKHSGTSSLCVFSGPDNFLSPPKSSVRRRKEDWNQSLSGGADVLIHYLR